MNQRPSKFSIAKALAPIALLACLMQFLPGIDGWQPVPQVKAQQAVGSNAAPPAGRHAGGIFVAYPGNGAEVTAPSTFIAGAVSPESTLTVNGASVKINKQGFFCQVVSVPPGESKFVLQRNGDASLTHEISVHRALPPQPVPRDPLQILKTSLEPRQDMGVSPGDTLQFAMRASPGAQACVKIGGRIIALQAGAKSGEVNRGLDTTYGVTYQRTAGVLDDLYTGFYRLLPTDNWSNEKPIFQIERDGSSAQAQSDAHIAVLTQPFLSHTLHDDTIVRTGPDASRTTPWPQGVRVLVDGFSGNWWRCEMAAGKHLWIDNGDLSGNEGAGSAPGSLVRTINIENEGAGGARVAVPLNQKLPFEIKQDISPVNRLQLTVYGATADTDWITEPSIGPSASRAPMRQGRAFPQASDRSKNPVSLITWQQNGDQVFHCTINLSGRQQWGFWAEYEGTTLVLHVKGAPHLTPGSIRGLKICLDPGHGGAETGAIGCSGIKEATINLAIGKYLSTLLASRGAHIVMTRTADVQVSLADRVKTAVEAGCQLLVSVHCNSLPDGRNPWVEHGTSSYYYQPQSLKLATALRRGEVEILKFADFHTRWQNLALCRPSQLPASLVEVGFVINPDEYATLITAPGQKRAAQGIAAGVQAFLKDSLWLPGAAARRHSK